MKKPAAEISSTTPRRRGQRVAQYVVLIVGCLLVIDALVGDKGLIAMLKARQQYRSLEASIERVTDENARLREQARRLREEPAAIEDLARRELGLIRPGEKLFIIRDVPAGESRDR